MKWIAFLLLASGLLIMIFSGAIVFPGLEVLLGIETIVGPENVSYNPDGTYFFTNPGAMIRWIASVALIGAGVAAVGGVLLWKQLRTQKT